MKNSVLISSYGTNYPQPNGPTATHQIMLDFLGVQKLLFWAGPSPSTDRK